VHVHPRFSDALAAGRPVVALESTIISHGLPGRTIARSHARSRRRCDSGGAVPATIAIIDGEPNIGLDDAALRRVAEGDTVVKVSVRDVAVLAARGGDRRDNGRLDRASGCGSGHLGVRHGWAGRVHRDARDSWDESADLMDPLAHRRAWWSAPASSRSWMSATPSSGWSRSTSA